jgi:hypothetical protein
MAEELRVNVSADALEQVLRALNGPSHYVRELQALMNFDPSNPIVILTREYNEQVELHNRSL